MDQSRLITAIEATALVGVAPETIRQWASRGYLCKQGMRGRAALYDIDDLRRVRAHTRTRHNVAPAFPQLDIPATYHNREITTTEVARLLGVAPSTVRAWVDRGHLAPTRRAGRSNMFRVGNVLAIHRSRTERHIWDLNS